MADFFDLADFLDALDDQLPQIPSDLAKQIVIACVDEMTTVTPADTGAAVSNWQVSLNQPATEEIDAYSRFQSRYHGDGSYKGGGTDPTTVRETNRPFVLDAAALVLASKRPEQDIYLTNVVGTNKEPNEPYILELDKGRSPQFPTGDFIGQMGLRVEQVLETARLVIR